MDDSVNKLIQLFDIKYGSKGYDNKSFLDKGNMPLIASQGVDNGVFGFFDVPEKYKRIITVPRTGSIGYAFVQLEGCNATDDCMVLLPKSEMTDEYLFYIATIIRNQRWRYNYGRKITPKRLAQLDVKTPTEFTAPLNFASISKLLIPKQREVKDIEYGVDTKEFEIGQFFKIKKGKYHSVNELEEGEVPLISCSEFDEGIAGFYDIPDDHTEMGKITVAYDGRPLTANFHPYKFAAYDNVGILEPKVSMKTTTLLFTILLLNNERWRYNYGRKCYKQKLEKLKIDFPIDKNGNINEKYIEMLFKSRDLFGIIKN